MVVLIPVKAFDQAKKRLSPALGPGEREALARRFAANVLDAARPLPAVVVCDDDGVAAWAASSGAQVLWRPGLGLNEAVQDGVATLASQGARRVVVCHSDLPLARSLAWVSRFPGITLVPDRHGLGTNVIGVPTDAGFRFAYGPNSFERHRAEARRTGRVLRIVRDPSLGWDVDVPDDLAAAEPVRG